MIDYSYISRGFYSKQILNYFKYFQREQFKFIIYEEFVKDQSQNINKILSFLDINKKVTLENKVVFQNKYEPMSIDERHILGKIYCEKINILENLLKIDLSIWKQGSTI